MVFPVGPGGLPAEVLRGGGELGEVVAVFGEGGKLPFCVFEEVVAGLRSEISVVGHGRCRGDCRYAWRKLSVWPR